MATKKSQRGDLGLSVVSYLRMYESNVLKTETKSSTVLLRNDNVPGGYT